MYIHYCITWCTYTSIEYSRLIIFAFVNEWTASVILAFFPSHLTKTLCKTKETYRTKHAKTATTLSKQKILKLVLDSTCCSAKFWTTPCHHLPVSLDGREGSLWGLNILNIKEKILNLTAVTTVPGVAPRHHFAAVKNGSKGLCRALNVLDFYQLVLYCTAITSIVLMTPSNNTAVCQDSSKCPFVWLHMLHILQLVLNFANVTSIICNAPCNNSPITFDRSKSCVCRLNLLHIFQLTLNFGAVSTIATVSPSDNASVKKDRSKCPFSWLNLLNIPGMWHRAMSKHISTSSFTKFNKHTQRTVGLRPVAGCDSHSSQVASSVFSLLWSLLLLCCHPMWQHFHLPKWLQMHCRWTEDAGHSVASSGCLKDEIITIHNKGLSNASMLLRHSHRFFVKLISDYTYNFISIPDPCQRPTICLIWVAPWRHDYNGLMPLDLVITAAHEISPSLDEFGHHLPNHPKQPPYHLPEWQRMHCWKTELQGHLPGLGADPSSKFKPCSNQSCGLNKGDNSYNDWKWSGKITKQELQLATWKMPRNCSSLFWCCPRILGHPRLSSCRCPRTMTQRHCTLRRA